MLKTVEVKIITASQPSQRHCGTVESVDADSTITEQVHDIEDFGRLPHIIVVFLLYWSIVLWTKGGFGPGSPNLRFFS